MTAEERIDTNRKTATIVGALFLIALFGSILGQALMLEPILKSPDYLSEVAANPTQVSTGMLIELINAASVVGIGFMLVPILRKHDEALAFGYLGFRIVESAIAFLTAVSLPALVAVGQEYARAGSPDVSFFHTLGTLLLAEHHWGFQMIIVANALGGLILCYLLYRSILVPRFFSVLGLIGYALSLVVTLLGIFGLSQEGIVMAAFVPGSLFETVFPLWLIVKGFNASAVVSESAQVITN